MARLAAYVHVSSPAGEPVVLGPDSDLPDWAGDVITNPKAWAEAPEPKGEGGGEGSGESKDGEGKSLTKAELEAEIERRNEGREDADKIVVPGKGNKPDLEKAIADDDAKASPAQQD